MYTGLLLNSTICFAIGLSSLAFAWVLLAKNEQNRETSRPALFSLVIFWTLVGLTYLPTSVRMMAAYRGNMEIDAILYFIAAVPFAFVSVPLVFFIIYIITGSKKTGEYLALLFTILGAAYLTFMYQSGIVGPKISEWASIFSVNSDLAIHIYLVGLFVIPTAMILGLLLLILLQRVPKRIRYRTVLPLVAISFVFDFMLTDVIAIIDVMQVFSRAFVLIGTVLAYLAYFPPLTIQEKLGIQKNSAGTYFFDGIEKEPDTLARDSSALP
jgi:glucan phosphoethanolaminetransferase (alkaline phosphatase superfamily)